MVGELVNQFYLTRAALSGRDRAKSNFQSGLFMTKKGLNMNTSPHYSHLILSGFTALSLTLCLVPRSQAAGWSATGSMTDVRKDHTATLLPNGQVLVTGGMGGDWPNENRSLKTMELYYPASGTWGDTGDEMWDSVTGRFRGMMDTPRDHHTATLLNDGTVLIAGGSHYGYPWTTIYEPSIGRCSPTWNMITPRSLHTATLLGSGKVLVAGGANTGGALAACEIYDPASGWSGTGWLNAARAVHTASLLPSGKVLVAGGGLASAELYDPAGGTWTTTGSMGAPRSGHTATVLNDGRVLVTGGSTTGGGYLATAEVYNPASGLWSPVNPMGTARYRHTATLLPNGTVLVAGGLGTFTNAELYDPGSGTWSSAGNMTTDRHSHTATLLPNMKVLLVGGFSYNTGASTNAGIVRTAELYDTGIPVNDNLSGSILLAENVYYSQNTANATDDGYSSCLGRDRTKGVWFVYLPAYTGTTTVDTCPSDFDNNLEVFYFNGTLFVTVGCNEDSTSCPNYWQASYNFTCTAGTPYFIYAGGYNGQSGNLSIRARMNMSIPANDGCSGAIALTENVYYSQVTSNATDDGYSPCLGRDRTKGVWFAYTPAYTGTAHVDTCPSDFDTMLEVFTGNCASPSSLVCNDDSPVCGNYRSATNFTCTAGATYYIWAGGYNGQVGNLQVRARVIPLIPPNDLCGGAVPLTENRYYSQVTSNATDDGHSACLGRTRTKGVWFTYTPASSGIATVDTCPSDFDNNLEIFNGTCGALTSIVCNEDSFACAGYWQASASFACTASTTYYIYAGGYNGQAGTLQIRARINTLAPANDDCSGAFALTENGYYSQITSNATDDGFSPCLGRDRTRGVWFAYTPVSTGTAAVDTCPSDFDTMLEVFTGNCASLSSLACNDDSPVCGNYKSATNFTCTAGTTYYIWAGGYNGQAGHLQIRASVAVTPIILTNLGYTASGSFRFTIKGDPGEYIVFGTSNFLDWHQLEILNNTSGSVDFTNTPPAGYTFRFYRCQKW
jgi:hypothetical protein